jgi:hypothetical protein
MILLLLTAAPPAPAGPPLHSGATVSGVIQLTATAPGNIAGVQFFVDGVKVGDEVAAAPFVTTWDTRQVPDGPHTVTATVRNPWGTRYQSAPTTVIVSNVVPSIIVQQL